VKIRQKRPSTNAAEAGDVEVVAEQLVETRQSLLPGGAAGHCLQPVAEIVDERGWIHARPNRDRRRTARTTRDERGQVRNGLFAGGRWIRTIGPP